MIMLHGGYIYAIGTPSEVLTKENIKAVYDVESEVIESHGRPHLIMLDNEFDDRGTELPTDTYASKVKLD
jgi:iron complex transport system ATP-binding protein